MTQPVPPQTSAEESDPRAKIPVRRCWPIGRLVAAIILFALAGGFLAWVFAASDPVSQEISAIKRRGEPWRLSKFKPPETTADRNAALLYRIWASRMPSEPDDEVRFYASYSKGIVNARRAEKMDAILARHAEMLAELRQAVSMPDVDWGVSLDNVEVNDALSLPLEQCGFMASMLASAAIRAHELGDDRLSFENLRAILAMASAYRQAPFHGMTSRSTFIEQKAIRVYIWVFGDLKIDGAGPTHDEVAALKDFLLDESALLREHQYQTWGERAISYHLLEREFAKKLHDKRVAAVHARYLVSMGQIAQARNYAEALAALPPDLGDADVAGVEPQIAEVIRTIPVVYGGKNRKFDQLLYYRALAYRRMAGTLLAAKLYAYDHSGLPPKDLQDLVQGKYLRALPADPLAAGEPLHFSPYQQVFCIWSVGPDGKDQHGDSDMMTGFSPPNDIYMRDYCLFLLIPPRWSWTIE